MLIRRKELKWIAMAFLLLCVISFYRLIIMRFFPDDPIRPYVGYFFYLLLLLIWWRSVCKRVTQHNMRVFLQVEQILMLLGSTVCFLIDVFMPYFLRHDMQFQNTSIMRFTGYSTDIPMILIPLFGLYASFGLGKTEEFRFNKKWYILLGPAIVMVLVTMTNESHHIVFRQWEDSQSSLFYIPNFGLYIIMAWAFALLFIRIFLLFRRSREPQEYTRASIVPFLIAVFMLLYNIPYIITSYVVTIGLLEYHVAMYFMEAMLWESCILTGMIPVNTHYEEVFDRSTVAMQIIDINGRLSIKSSEASELSEETFGKLKNGAIIRTLSGQELHLHTITGGYAVWQNDVSETLAVIDELQKSTEILLFEGDLLRQELSIRSDEVTVREQNLIYNRLTEEIGGQLQMLRNLLDKRDLDTDIIGLFKKICLVGTYIKRKCCLRLIEQSDGIITNKDLELCYLELTGCLQQMGVLANVFWSTVKTPDPEFAMFTLDVFELLLEYERFELDAVKVTFETDAVFSMHVYCSSSSLGKIPSEELKRLNRENYTIDWQTLKNGYQVSVRSRGN